MFIHPNGYSAPGLTSVAFVAVQELEFAYGVFPFPRFD